MSSLSPKSEPGEPPRGTPTNPAVPPPPLVGQVPGATPQMWHQAPGPPPAHETGPAWGFRAHSLPVYLLSHFLPRLLPACLTVGLLTGRHLASPGSRQVLALPYPPARSLPCERSMEGGPHMSGGSPSSDPPSRKRGLVSEPVLPLTPGVFSRIAEPPTQLTLPTTQNG